MPINVKMLAGIYSWYRRLTTCWAFSNNWPLLNATFVGLPTATLTVCKGQGDNKFIQGFQKT